MGMESSVREDCLYKEWVFGLTVALGARNFKRIRILTKVVEGSRWRSCV